MRKWVKKHRTSLSQACGDVRYFPEIRLDEESDDDRHKIFLRKKSEEELSVVRSWGRRPQENEVEKE